MIVYPAVDLRDGYCVQLVGGSYDNELLRLENPAQVAKDWKEKGFNNLHIVDLDRATNNGDNLSSIKEIISEVADDGFEIRVGGGIRFAEDIENLLDAGASSFVIGSKGIKEFSWFKEIVELFPGKIYIALEVNGTEVKVDGWQTGIDEDLYDLILRYSDLNIAGIFVTAIHKEGLRQGTDITLFKGIVERTSQRVVASGGITNIGDIEALSKVGVAEVVLGAALYMDDNFVLELKQGQYIGRQ